MSLLGAEMAFDGTAINTESTWQTFGWAAGLLGGGCCAALGALIVVTYDSASGLGPLETMVPLVGALVLTVFSSTLAREIT